MGNPNTQPATEDALPEDVEKEYPSQLTEEQRLELLEAIEKLEDVMKALKQ